MVTKNHFAFNICEEAAEESELEKRHEFQNSKQNEGFVAYDYLGAFKSKWLTSKWTKLLAGVEKERMGGLANFSSS